MSQEEIQFPLLPMSPSSNSQYRIVKSKRTGRMLHAPSKELRIYKAEMLAIGLQYSHFFKDAKKKVNLWLDTGHLIYLDTYFFFDPNKIWTKKMQPKRLDLTNRIKACDDCICELLEIEDHVIFRRTAHKRTRRLTPDQEQEEWILAFIGPIDPADTILGEEPWKNRN